MRAERAQTAQLAGQRSDCRHNESLECRAPFVSVGSASKGADCLSYAAA
ncbi:hypothetical protein SAMN05421756_107180 [Microlunatus flavus]|uniref:Uncharacterized protein n=1 Tax=Microlunatus flavus TaxID=1036181 RepID=A0A1H9KEZ9_9ACTN|nr:hypothetical protein SAMN05421756_107180 [Microlunatus flavus]